MDGHPSGPRQRARGQNPAYRLTHRHPLPLLRRSKTRQFARKSDAERFLDSIRGDSPEAGSPQCDDAMKRAFDRNGVSTRQHNEPAGNQDGWHYSDRCPPHGERRSLRSSREAGDPSGLCARAALLNASWPDPPNL